MGPGQPAGTQWGRASSSGPSKCKCSSGQALTPGASGVRGGRGLVYVLRQDGRVLAVLCAASSCFLYFLPKDDPIGFQLPLGLAGSGSKRSTPARSLRATTGRAVPHWAAAGGLTAALLFQKLVFTADHKCPVHLGRARHCELSEVLTGPRG